MKKKISVKLREHKKGIIFIRSTKNNTIITFSNLLGNVLFWESGGTLGFKNSRKSTVYAAGAAAEKVISKAMHLGYNIYDIKMKGTGFGKRNALKTIIKIIVKAKLIITSIEERTSIPHNGCRLPKKRRL
ncbi:30S ribosomal protein S11 [Paenibacillus sp. MAHUQ-46]|uniref:Small ribosomal subunit protein uS11 n=1 Tax=Paenibacillus roseus TaxID=2798579 RepID=A0A934MQD8_9BACL|nr:30S ribosomal protein S11 [Paenibacillus roseus]MBJ6361778.1 30S ribosomal protein S11 [Paenibacillus roseus]